MKINLEDLDLKFGNISLIIIVIIMYIFKKTFLVQIPQHFCQVSWFIL